jgi:hypothetical protein
MPKVLTPYQYLNFEKHLVLQAVSQSLSPLVFWSFCLAVILLRPLAQMSEIDAHLLDSLQIGGDK